MKTPPLQRLEGQTMDGARPLAPYLWLVIGLQGCLYLGMQLSPLVSASWSPPAPTSAVQQAARWRQARYTAQRDPKVGSRAAPLHLVAQTGSILELEDLQGAPAALIFVDEESG